MGTSCYSARLRASKPMRGGGGYNAAKFAVRAVRDVRRCELLGPPIRVTAIAPGMVETEFRLVRFRGDDAKGKRNPIKV